MTFTFTLRSRIATVSYSRECKLTCIVLVECLNTRDDGWRKYMYRISQKHVSVSLHDLSPGRHLLGDSFRTSLKSNLCTAATTQNTTEQKCIVRQTNKVTALQPHVFLTELSRLLVTNKGGSPFPSAKTFQGQL